MRVKMTMSLVPLLAICVYASPLCAQSSTEQVTPEPRRAENPTTQWAIAPEPGAVPSATLYPEGTVLQQDTLLPAGTVFPGGAIPPGTPSAPAPTTESAMQADVASGVPYISGGVGLSGRDEMNEIKSKFNLRLLFAVQGSGVYLADVKVKIDDAAGPTLLSVVSQGPWFYANLTPGRYVVTVDNAGQTQTKEVTVPANGAVDQPFYWAD